MKVDDIRPFYENLDEYKKQMRKGVIPRAYRGLMQYILDLRTYFESRYPGHFVSGSIYHGYMDMTYFSFFPPSLQKRKLKVAIVFLHETCKFDAWLVGYNKQVQSKYWQLIKNSDWKKYPVVQTIKGADAIIEHTLVAQPDFSNLGNLTQQIETAVLNFIENIEDFLSMNQNQPG